MSSIYQQINIFVWPLCSAVYHGPALSFFFCTALAGPQQTCLSVSLSVCLPPCCLAPGAVFKHPSRRDSKLWQRLSPCLKDGKWRCETSRMCWERTLNRWPLRKKQLLRLGGIVIAPSSCTGPHPVVGPSLQATSCSKPQLHIRALCDHWHTQDYAGEQSASCHEKSAGTSAFSSEVEHGQPNPGACWRSKLQPHPRERHSACWEVTVKVTALFSALLNMDVNMEDAQEWRSTAGPGRSLESMQMSRICLDPGKIRRLREDWGHMVQMMQGLKAAADDIVWLKSKYFTSF